MAGILAVLHRVRSSQVGFHMQSYIYDAWTLNVNLSARRGWPFNANPWLCYSWETDPVSIIQEAGWARGSIWTGVKNLAFTRIHSLDHSACSKSLLTELFWHMTI